MVYATGYLRSPIIGNCPTSLSHHDRLQQHASGDVDDMRVDAAVNISFEVMMSESDFETPALAQYVAAQTEEYQAVHNEAEKRGDEHLRRWQSSVEDRNLYGTKPTTYNHVVHPVGGGKKSAIIRTNQSGVVCEYPDGCRKGRTGRTPAERSPALHDPVYLPQIHACSPRTRGKAEVGLT